MAGRSAVISVIVTGEEQGLNKTFDEGAKSAKGFRDEIDKTSKGFDGLRDGADSSERRFIGLSDSIGGTGDVMEGFRTGNVAQLAMGMADLSGAVANLGADLLDWGKKAFEAGANAAKGMAASTAAAARNTGAWIANKAATIASTVATQAQTAAQWLLNAAMSANPIMLVVVAIAALTAGLVIAYKESETFRNIVNGAFDAVKAVVVGVYEWVRDNWPLLLAILTGPIGLAVLAITRNWDTIKDGFTAVKDWIGDRVTDVVGFFTGLPGRIASAGAGMFDFLKDSFRAAVNWIIDAWNGLEFSIPGFDPPGPGPKFGGFTLGVPDIPRLAAGGITTGPMLAMVGDNPSGHEAIIPLDRLGALGGTTIIIHGDVYGFDDFDKKVRDAQARNQRRGI